MELKKILGFDLTKAKKYINDPSKAPEGANVEQGPRGGYYYDIVDTESKKPETGLGKLETLSISNKEEAIKQMSTHINQLNKTPGGRDMLVGVEQYTGGAFKWFNNYLRSGKVSSRNPVTGKISAGKPTKNQIDRLNMSMDKVSKFIKESPKIQTLVYRGMVWDKDKKSMKSFNDFMSSVEGTNSISLPTFTSTSLDQSTAMDFASKKTGSESVVIEMRSKNGVYLNGSSIFPKEDEVLFDRNSKFNIVSVNKKTKPYKIVLEEL